MVDLVEEWEDIARYTRYLPENIRSGSSYQLRKAEDSVEIKVRVCKYGYTRKFKNDEDPELIKILAFCKAEGFIKIQTSVLNEFFYA